MIRHKYRIVSLQNLIKYYNQCYQADNRGLILKNIFSSSIENRFFFENIEEELATGYLPYYPIDENYGEEIAKKISLAEKEKELVYCSTFIVGYDSNNKSTSKVCSPLFLIPAKIIESEEEYSVELDRENLRVNFQIFSEINSISGDSTKFLEDLFLAIHDNKVDEQTIHDIISIIEKYTNTIDTSNLLNFPTLFDKKSINNLYQRKFVKEDGGFFVVPAGALAIVGKSVNTRGIINELTEISNTNEFSQPILSIFDNEKTIEKVTLTMPKGHVPAILNNAQNSIIENSSKFPFSVIIGPPGTGKTYTISALAIEKMSIGKSVLIVSKTDKAVDIIAEKIENQLNLENVIVRAGRSTYKKDLVKHLSMLLSNYYFSDDEITSKVLQKKLAKLDKKIFKKKATFNKRVKDELSWGRIIAKKKPNIFDKIKRNFINWRNEALDNHFELMRKIYRRLIDKNLLILKLIKTKYDENIKFALKHERDDLQKLLQSLRARHGSKQEKLFDEINFDAVLKVFPIWLVKMSDIYKVLPLRKELFDYVIIDEATQCDISSSIPILQRGKKAIITGDPNQLRHFSFISAAQQNLFKEKLELSEKYEPLIDYKNKSTLDIVSENAKSNHQFVFLDEHYRSLPSIIEFSNANIYNNALKIMTSRPLLKENDGIKLHQCNGKREKSGYNKEETQKVLEIVKNIIFSERHIEEKLCSSVGILSPFRDQVENISKEITNNFTLTELKKHQVSINTPYGFQGDERDIMILSFVVDNSANAMSFRYLNKEEVFNVAITRARKMQHIVHSIDTKALKSDYLLRQYLESFEKTKLKTQTENKQDIKNEFALDVKKELEIRGFEIHIGFNIAGLNVDIVACKDGHNYGIDLIGFPGMYEEAISMERYKMLTRANLPTFPLAYTYWIADKNKTIMQFIGNTE